MNRLDRRDFLRQGTAAALGAGALDALAATPPAPRVQQYKRLGRTGLEISDISFGSSRTSDPAVVRHAYERGINYFDTAEGYRGGASEEAIGAALHGVRDKVWIASKTEAAADARSAEFMAALEGSLRRLRTDRIDVYFNHAVNDTARLRNPEWAEFLEKAKREGKIRWRGMSGHGGRLAECLDLALGQDLVDVILVAHNFGQDPAFYQRLLRNFDYVAVQPELPGLMERAHAAGVGVIAMKTLMGARLNDMRPHEHGSASFAQAAFRWVLANPNVDALVVSMTGREQIDEYLGASGAARNRRSDLELLRRYALAQLGSYCQHGCGHCEASCPSGVPISEVLRTRMYRVDYADPELARAAYAGLGAGASACLACAAVPCLGACPNGIPIADFTRDAALHGG